MKAAFSLLCALPLVACGRGPWSVVRQAEPNPIHGATRFYLEPPTFEGGNSAPVVIEGYTAGFEREGGERFKRVGVAADADFIVRTSLSSQIGSTTRVVLLQQRIVGDVTITDAKGQLVDEIRTGTDVQSASPQNTEATLRDAGATLGAAAGRYVKKRIDD